MGIASARQRLKPFLMAPVAAAAITCLLGNQAGAQPSAGTETPVEQGKGLYATLGLGGSGAWSQSTNAYSNGRYIYNGGFTGDLGIGYDFGPLRLEATYAYSSHANPKLDFNGGSLAIDGTHVRLNSGYLSAYWDIPITDRIIPYIGGGIGGTNYSYGAGTIDSVPYKANNFGSFAYQAKAGVTYVLSRQADLFVEGTYQGASGFVIPGGLYPNEYYGTINVWGAKGGVRWRFGGGAPRARAVALAPVLEPAPAPAPIPEPAAAPAPVRGLW